LIRLSPQNRKRLIRFKSIRRGWVSLWILLAAYVLSLGSELLIGSRPLFVSYQGETYFPAFNGSYYPDTLFGGTLDVETDFRALAESEEFIAAGGHMLMPLHPFSPLESVIVEGDRPPARPHWRHPAGTDDRGRDVFARLVYGFRTAISFALVLAVVSFVVGIVIGAVQAYYGGWLDLIFQRLIEIWVALPFLYVVLMVSSIVRPSFTILVGILLIFGWVPVSRYTRAEILRERSRDYVTAARAQGASAWRIMFIHALPNSMTPLVTLFPFRLVANIFILTALDFLGYGLPAPTPSWGELLSQARGHLNAWWLTMAPFSAMLITLLLTSFIGEAVREAWDPKTYLDKE